MLLLTVTSWLDRQEREILAYLNRVLRRQLGGRRPRLTDDDRGQLAARAYLVVCENSADGLRGLAVVELEHAAEPLTAPYWARSE